MRVFVTVARTGTMHKISLIALVCPLELEAEEWTEGRMLFAHCADAMMPLIRAAKAKGYSIITTRRENTDAIHASAALMGMKAADIDEQLANWPEVAAMADVVIDYDATADDPAVLAARALP